jgi:hypothetical protein
MPHLITDTLRVIDEYFIPYVPLKQIHLFKFGLATLSLSPYDSLNANARMYGWYDIRASAESKMYRLSKNVKIRELFSSLIPHLHLITPDSIVNIDFSTFATRAPHPEFQVLAFGIQTYLGRAIPLFFDIIRYPITQVGSQNIFIIDTITKLGKILVFYPAFVLDRGFAIPTLIEFFVAEGIIFYVRSKKGKLVTMKAYKDTEELDRLVAAGKIKQKDTKVTVYGKPLRLLISDKDNDHAEPWYILTNDFVSPRKKVIETYYHRFEIEETFKDLKHIQGLEILQVAKETTFKTILWFMILGYWIGYLTEGVVRKAATSAQHRYQYFANKHKTLSYFRCFFEQIQRCFYFVTRHLIQKPGTG